jgi:broad specificity phosphatase PhoE
MNDGSSIMLIRHAEKPEDGEQAVDRRGHPDDESLSVTGWMRAGALVRMFALLEGRPGEPHIVRPLHLVAARATATHPSTRPRDTLQPLAAALGVPIDETLAADDPLPAIAAHLNEMSGPLLVCWRHETLPALADELLQRSQAPTRWPDGCYDMVWVIEQQRFTRTLAQVPQRLLPGDATQAIRRRVPARH